MPPTPEERHHSQRLRGDEAQKQYHVPETVRALGTTQRTDRTEILGLVQRIENRDTVRAQAREQTLRVRRERVARVARAISRKVNEESLVLFTRQLSTMISAGIPLLEGLRVLEGQATEKPLKKLCARLADAIQGGEDLARAMRATRAFPPLYVSLVRTGEISGNLDLLLNRLADYVEFRRGVRSEVRSAMAYPVLSFVMITGISAYLLLGILPSFEDAFADLGSDLPALTAKVLALSHWLQARWVPCLGFFLGAVAAIWAAKRTRPGSLACDWLSLRAPIVGPIVHKIVLARFARTFATLVRSAVPILHSLDVTADVSGNALLAHDVRVCRDKVSDGATISDTLGRSAWVPPMLTQMIGVGERSGSLDLLLEKAADFYDAEARASISTLSSLAMPVMITVLGGVVGVILLAVFLAMIKLVQLGN